MDFPASNFKQNFEQELFEYEQHNQGSHRKPWTQERISEVINHLKHAMEAMKSGKRRAPMEYYWMSKYDIMTVENEDHLIFKRKNTEDPALRIIPREQYFTILSEIHKSNGHGGRDKMLSNIKTRFYIPKKVIEIFVYLCPTCETKRNNPKRGIVIRPILSHDFNVRGQFDLIDFQTCSDGEYKWLLNYQDDATKFLNLRALKTNRPNEIATELMKIFLTFGAPSILESDDGREFTAKVIEELTLMLPDCRIIQGQPQTQESVERNNQDIESMLRSWMNENKSTNWSVGCFFIQYQKNVSYHRLIGKSPYKALFRSDPKVGENSLNDTVAQPTNTNSNSNNDLKTEPGHSTAAHAPPQNCNNDLETENTYLSIPKLEQKRNLTCVVCENVINSVYVVCGSVEGAGSQVVCLMCKSEPDVDFDKTEAHKGIKRTAEGNTYKKWTPLAISSPSIFGNLQKCVCKPAPKQCASNRCICFKKNIMCSSKCHKSLTCFNK